MYKYGDRVTIKLKTDDKYSGLEVGGTVKRLFASGYYEIKLDNNPSTLLRVMRRIEDMFSSNDILTQIKKHYV